MLDEQVILSCIEQTMVSDAKVIKLAESKLHEFQKEDGFASFLLEVISNDGVPLNIRISSAIYLKNKIQRSWKDLRNESGIKPEEQMVIKKNLIQALVKNVQNNHLRPHITESIRGVLTHNDEWDLISAINELITSGNDEYVYAGLLLLFEVCLTHRWDMIENRNYIDRVITETFPTVENIASQLINSDKYHSSESLYLILKSFKYGCLYNFPTYFKNIDKLNAWVQMHLYLCAKPLPKQVLDLDTMSKSLDKRVKVNKWAFGNMSRFITKYSRTTKVVNEEFVNYTLSQIAPTILQDYFKVIQSWSNGELWLSESSLYYLVQFLEKCVTTDSLYPMIESHLEVIIKNVIFPCLCADSKSLELLEEDEEEYTRRYFDLNKEGSTADVASTDFIFVVGHKRPEKMHQILPFVNDIFNNFAQNSDNIENAYKEEGAMRVVSTLFSFLESSNELENIFGLYIVPLLSQARYPFLNARALETLSLYGNSFKDMTILSKLFEAAYKNFMESDVLPVRVEAADALKTLIISNTEIHQHITSQVPGIMEKLLNLSKEFEIDILSEVMEAFVERFADVLTPFAEDLAASLCDQFLQLGRTLVESSSSSYSSADQNQELQASALLQTMTTMVMSMNKVSLIDKFLPVVKFVILNAQISFLTEIVDLMDSLALSSISLYKQFTPPIWEMFQDVLETFQTYAMDYFESYTVFFETVVSHGFTQDSTFIGPFFEVLSVKLDSEVDYDVESVLDLLVFYALSLKDIPLFVKALTASANEELDLEDASIIKLFLANLYVKPVETLQITETNGMTLTLLQKWFAHNFTSVFGIKLQIMAILTLLNLPELPSCVNGFISQFADKLVTLSEKLPNAIRIRDSMANGEEDVSEIFEDAEQNEDYFEGYEDDLKETTLDQTNCFQELNNFFTQIRETAPTKYQQIISSLSEDKQHSLQVILEFVSQN